MADVGVAATQMACSWERDANIDRAENLVRQAAAGGLLLSLWRPGYAGRRMMPRFVTIHFTAESRQDRLR